MGEVRHGGLFSIAPNLCLERLFLLVATLDRTPVSGASAAYECPLLGEERKTYAQSGFFAF
jgi:hypothetical protein